MLDCVKKIKETQNISLKVTLRGVKNCKTNKIMPKFQTKLEI